MMNRSTLLMLLIFTLLITACGASAPEAAGPASSESGDPAARELSPSIQVAIGTLRLADTENAVTAEQAQELLPLWQTMQVLSESDTAAQQETEALITQIQETMSPEQMQAITDMNLTQEDMMTLMQEQGLATGPADGLNNSAQGGNPNGGGGFGPAGGFPDGAPPPGGFPGDGPDEVGGGGGQGSGLSPDQIATAQASRQTGTGTTIPPMLINELVEYLQEKAGPASEDIGLSN